MQYPREDIVVSPEEMSRQKQIALHLRDQFQGKQYYINTYGCQMNVQDSQHMAGILEEIGFLPAPTQEDADIVFFNTCCVRDNAERRAMGNLGFLSARKKENPDLLLGICGCMVQQDGKADEILSRFPNVDFCFGTHELYRLPEMIQKRMETGRAVEMVLPANSHGFIAEGMPIRRTSSIQNYVTIMYGCNNFCSYCIVPYVRGRERSRDPEEIIQEVRNIAQNGVKEVMLLGQNVNSYGKDLDGRTDFADLLKELDGTVPRIRFMTSHPKDLSDKLIDTIASSRSVCHHIHLPLQSGSDRILKLMNRHYTAEAYAALVQRICSSIPDISLTTDLIVGFPSEEETDFQATLDLVKACRFDSAFTFNYSPRKGTKAADMDGQVPQEIMTDRIQRLIALQEQITQENYCKYLGKTGTVLTEGTSLRDPEMLTGKLSQGITVNFSAPLPNQQYIGEFVDVEIRSAGHNTLRGALIHK